jgi:hypothetical protein
MKASRLPPLQLKDFPTQLKTLIKREANSHRRTLTQEAIVLLEEAVVARASSQLNTREEIAMILDRYEKLATKDKRPMAEIIEYDELGLPK